MADVCSSLTARLPAVRPAHSQLHWQADDGREHDAIGPTETHRKSVNVKVNAVGSSHWSRLLLR